MESTDPFPIHFRGKLSEDFERDDISEFIKKYTLKDERVGEYKKAKKLENISENIAIGSLFITLFSFLALILIPTYSITARFIINTLGVPEVLSGYISGTPNVETSTLLVVGIICGISFVFSIISFFVSSSLVAMLMIQA